MKSLGSWAVLAACAMLFGGPAVAGDIVPHDGDPYSALVARAEADDATVDFKAMRFAWLDSAARKREPDLSVATKAMWEAARANDAAAARAAAEKIIAAHYTDFEAHKFRRQSCVLLKDTACSDHEHFVEFGLLNSIVKGGDGKTPETAWVVAEISEEYAMMRILQVQLKLQSLINRNGRTYDEMTVVGEDGKEQALWFDISVAITKEFPGLS